MLYRWPQGRIIRVLCLILAALIAVDLGWYAWAMYGQYAAELDKGQGDWQGLALVIIFGVLALGSLFAGVFCIGLYPKTAQFLIEVETEMAKVTWPTRSELTRLTVMIAIVSVVLSGMIMLVDFMNKGLQNLVYSLGGA